MRDNAIGGDSWHDDASLDPVREAQLATALARCASGDHSALEMIYRGEAPRMIGVARRILFRQDLAEEALHAAFVQIWCAAAAFDPHRGSARGWLYAAVRDCARQIHRDEHRVDAADPGVDPGAREIDCAATLTRLPDASALRACLERIELPQRDTVVLAYVHGMSYGELAGRLKVPLGTVKGWVRRSLVSLQECMG